MKKISVLVFEDAVGSAVIGTLEILSAVNQFLAQKGKEAPFTIETIGISAREVPLSIGTTVYCDRSMDETERIDLIVVPAFNGNPEDMLRKYDKVVPWLNRMYDRGSELASMCLGAFFLAATGLLDGKSCTTHWMGMEEMSRLFPQVQLNPDQIVTDQDGIYTSGGAYSSLNLIIYLVDKFCSREASIWASKFFAIDMGRDSQAPFFIFNNQKKHEDELIEKVQMYIEANYSQILVVEELANRFGVSQRNFIRRFKKATRNTPLQYIQRVRIEAAKKELEQGMQSLSDVMFSIGYSDMKSFREMFKRITGITPSEYRRKYNRVDCGS
ncbi:MAG: GlxA family transcriptional regulator [Marinifilaceae bacterium]